ncbi:Uncharacterised protein [Chlamydia trachomatis]|nr:Uncharacterised protein [Chlamydia trachomatis]
MDLDLPITRFTIFLSVKPTAGSCDTTIEFISDSDAPSCDVMLPKFNFAFVSDAFASPKVIPTTLGTTSFCFIFTTTLTVVPLSTLVFATGFCDKIVSGSSSLSFPFSIAPNDNPNFSNRSLACSIVNPFKSGTKITDPPLLTVKCMIRCSLTFVPA